MSLETNSLTLCSVVVLCVLFCGRIDRRPGEGQSPREAVIHKRKEAKKEEEEGGLHQIAYFGCAATNKCIAAAANLVFYKQLFAL